MPPKVNPRNQGAEQDAGLDLSLGGDAAAHSGTEQERTVAMIEDQPQIPNPSQEQRD